MTDTGTRPEPASTSLPRPNFDLVSSGADSIKKVVDTLTSMGLLVVLLGVLTGTPWFIRQYIGVKTAETAEISAPKTLRRESLRAFLVRGRSESLITQQLAAQYSEAELGVSGSVVTFSLHVVGYPSNLYPVRYAIYDSAGAFVSANLLVMISTETTDDGFGVLELWVPPRASFGTIVLQRRTKDKTQPDKPIALRTFKVM